MAAPKIGSRVLVKNTGEEGFVEAIFAGWECPDSYEIVLENDYQEFYADDLWFPEQRLEGAANKVLAENTWTEARTLAQLVLSYLSNELQPRAEEEQGQS